MIEFIDGDHYCTWNGTLMSPENHEKLFGISEELDVFSDDLIDSEGILYSDLPLGEILIQIGEVVKDPDGGPEKLILFLDYVKNIKIKPFCDFILDHPKFDIAKYTEFYDELDKYYDELRRPWG